MKLDKAERFTLTDSALPPWTLTSKPAPSTLGIHLAPGALTEVPRDGHLPLLVNFSPAPELLQPIDLGTIDHGQTTSTTIAFDLTSPGTTLDLDMLPGKYQDSLTGTRISRIGVVKAAAGAVTTSWTLWNELTAAQQVRDNGGTVDATFGRHVHLTVATPGAVVVEITKIATPTEPGQQRFLRLRVKASLDEEKPQNVTWALKWAVSTGTSVVADGPWSGWVESKMLAPVKVQGLPAGQEVHLRLPDAESHHNMFQMKPSTLTTSYLPDDLDRFVYIDVGHLMSGKYRLRLDWYTTPAGGGKTIRAGSVTVLTIVLPDWATWTMTADQPKHYNVPALDLVINSDGRWYFLADLHDNDTGEWTRGWDSYALGVWFFDKTTKHAYGVRFTGDTAVTVGGQADEFTIEADGTDNVIWKDWNTIRLAHPAGHIIARDDDDVDNYTKGEPNLGYFHFIRDLNGSATAVDRNSAGLEFHARSANDDSGPVLLTTLGAGSDTTSTSSGDHQHGCANTVDSAGCAHTPGTWGDDPSTPTGGGGGIDDD